MSEYQIEALPKGVRKIVLLAVGLVLAVLIGIFVYYETKVSKPASSENLPVTFKVEKGWSLRQIAESLNADKIISNPTIFIVYGTLHDAAKKIQAGEYNLNANMNTPEIIFVLTSGKVIPNGQNVTIIEGWTNKQIGKYLVQREIIKDQSVFDDALKNGNYNFKFNDLGKKFSYEGFLFPDTYKLNKTDGAEELVAKMLKNFETKITPQTLADIDAQNLDLSRVLIMASIIEKEVGRNKENLTAQDLKDMQTERELVSSVFYNRLKIGMRLESDATVNYVTGKADRSVLIADTKVNSPYNTYQEVGLPPTPIGNPGLGAIQAAIHPAQSDYIFFLNKPDGVAVFAKTLAEHSANKAKYLK